MRYLEITITEDNKRYTTFNFANEFEVCITRRIICNIISIFTGMYFDSYTMALYKVQSKSK